MGLGLDLEAGARGGLALRRAVADACGRHGLLVSSPDDEPSVDDPEAELDLADDLVGVEVYPQDDGLFADLSTFEDSAAASEQFARVLRDLVESVIEAGGRVRESDGGALVDPTRIGHLVP